MDIDNSTAGTEANGGGIEQALLQQFSCMGTTDKDELITQLQKVIGAHLNYANAAFFLDMNNWNLQAAICSYFDIQNNSKLPSMSLIFDPTASENENIEPNTRFKKSWNFYNSGQETWPLNCYMQCSAGTALSNERPTVPTLLPGETAKMTVDMVSPAEPGIYQSKWRLCTQSGAYFGDPMWLIVTVVEQGTMDVTNQLLHLNDLGSSVSTTVAFNPFRPQQQQQNQTFSNNDSQNMS